MKFLVVRAFALLSLLLVTGCMAPEAAEPRLVITPVPGTPIFNQPNETAGSYPAPAQTAEAYPGPQATTATSADGRSKTVLESYDSALQRARTAYNPDVQLYGVVPSGIMIGNLGGLPVAPGWFYRFKATESRREFVVQVVDGQATGSTTAEPIEDPTPAELPIDVSQIKIDSAQVLTLFKERAPALGITPGETVYDLELVNLAGKGGPTWSVVDPATKQWLFSVSAVSGEEVPNPHQ